MSSFILKLVAILTMFCDHLGYAIYGKFSFLNYIGRLAFPIFAFQISEGYRHTKSKKNYLMRLFLFALISQVPFSLFCSIFQQSFVLNIFFTLFIGLVAIIGYEQIKNKALGIIFGICLSFTADLIHADYGSWGVLFIFMFHVLKEKKWLMNLSFLILVLAKYLPSFLLYNFYPPYLLLALCMLLSLIFINCYNGKKGINTKYLLYTFYPLHLILLYVFHVIFIV